MGKTGKDGASDKLKGNLGTGGPGALHGISKLPRALQKSILAEVHNPEAMAAFSDLQSQAAGVDLTDTREVDEFAALAGAGIITGGHETATIRETTGVPVGVYISPEM